MEFRQTESIIIHGSFRSQTSNQSATKTSPYDFKKEYKMEKEEIICYMHCIIQHSVTSSR